MREPLFEPKAPKQTVSITLNSDLYAKAKSAGINTSKVAEEALASKYAELQSEAIKAELQRGLAAGLGTCGWNAPILLPRWSFPA